MSRLKDILQPRSVAGLCFILVALFLLLDGLGINLFHKILSNWPLALIIIGVAMVWGPNKSADKTLPWVLIILGVVFFLGQFRFFRRLDLGDLLIPLILLGIGLYLLKTQFIGPPGSAVQDNRIQIFSVLGGGEFNTRSDNLGGGHVVCILGGAEVDIRDADMQGDTMTLGVLSLLGGVDIKVPLHWQVSVKAVPLLGGVSNKTSCMAEKLQMPKKTLVINGLALMGGIDVRN